LGLAKVTLPFVSATGVSDALTIGSEERHREPLTAVPAVDRL
jgi:hypothetical protein